MKILGKAILYILVYWLLGSFLENIYSGVIYEMVSDADKILENLMPTKLAEEGFFKGRQVINVDTWQYGLFDNKGANLISFALVLIFYLGVDKKVWKQ